MADTFDALVRPAEGSRLTVYDDATGKPIVPGSVVKGHPTIGIGRALDVNGLTPEEEEYLYQNDKDKAVLAVARALPWVNQLDQVRAGVLTAMAFQMGIGGLLEFTQFLLCLKNGEYEAAAADMLDSLWARQTPARAQQYAQVMRSGELPTTN